MRKCLLTVFLLMAMSSDAFGQISVPYSFVNGTAADADQVNADMAKFADALNRTGGTMTGTLISQQITPATTNLYDLGTASVFFRSQYLRTSIVLGQTAGNYTLTWANPAAARAISIADPGGTDVFTFNAATQTLTNKTLTSPTITAATMTGATTITSPTISGPTLSGTVIGTYTIGGTPTFPATVPLTTAANTFTATGAQTFGATVNGENTLALVNSNVGNAAGTGLVLGNNTSASIASLKVYGTGFSSSGLAAASRLVLTNSGVGGTTIAATDASTGFLRFYAGGTTERFGINQNGDWLTGASEHIMDSVGTPVITSGFGGGGSTIAGNDSVFVVTPAASANTGGVVTFGHTFANAAVCSVDTVKTGQNPTLATTTTTVTITYPSAGTADPYYVLCRSY